MRRVKLILGALAVVVATFAVLSGPALAADDDCDFRERGDRDDVVVCRDDGDREVFDANDYIDNDYIDNDYIDNDYYDRYFDEDDFFFEPFFFSPFVFVEEIDVDCDEIDDDFDGWVDEGAVCEVEFEFE
jgi:hypothetical protein